jgi:hypothetical protein
MAEAVFILFCGLAVTVAGLLTFLWLVDTIHEAYERLSEDE